MCAIMETNKRQTSTHLLYLSGVTLVNDTRSATAESFAPDIAAIVARLAE
jgi:hypothetical protein